MIVTREEVVQSATGLFKERGFLSTTIQDIADDCGIAKGSVYKYFPSKEDLFSEVFNQCHNNYFDQVDELTRLPGLSPEEQFVQQIVLRFRYFMEYKHILVEFTELPIQQDPKFQPLRHKVRGGSSDGIEIVCCMCMARKSNRSYGIWLPSIGRF